MNTSWLGLLVRRQVNPVSLKPGCPRRSSVLASITLFANCYKRRDKGFRDPRSVKGKQMQPDTLRWLVGQMEDMTTAMKMDASSTRGSIGGRFQLSNGGRLLVLFGGSNVSLCCHLCKNITASFTFSSSSHL